MRVPLAYAFTRKKKAYLEIFGRPPVFRLYRDQALHINKLPMVRLQVDCLVSLLLFQVYLQIIVGKGIGYVVESVSSLLDFGFAESFYRTMFRWLPIAERLTDLRSSDKMVD